MSGSPTSSRSRPPGRAFARYPAQEVGGGGGGGEVGPVYLPTWLYAHHADLPWVAVHLTGQAGLPPFFTSSSVAQ